MVTDQARIFRNAEMFDRTAAHRAKVPVSEQIVGIIRAGRDAGEAVDRDEYR